MFTVLNYFVRCEGKVMRSRCMCYEQGCLDMRDKAAQLKSSIKRRFTKTYSAFH